MLLIPPALLNPLRFIDVNAINESFDGNFANNQVEDWQSGRPCYKQPFERTDNLTLQIIADSVPTDLNILNIAGQIVASIAWTANTLPITGYPTYTIYEIVWSFNNIPNGEYVIQQDDFEAEVIDLQTEHSNTKLIRYKNSDNNEDVIFDTGIEFQFRTQCYIGNFTPKNNRIVYDNQQKDPTQLNSVAYRQFTLYVGYSGQGQAGVPQWVLDKVNIIQTCDEVLYDGIKYQAIEGAEWDIDRDETQQFVKVGGKIEIESTNKFIKFVTNPTNPGTTFTPVRQLLKYLNQGADFTIVGGGSTGFIPLDVLDYVLVNKYSAGNTTVKLGTTIGGNEIGEFIINQATSTKRVAYPFDTIQNVYISGFTGADLDLIFIYDRGDATAIPINPSVASSLPKGAKMLWEGSDAEFNTNWDKATGLGKPNTGWQDWTIAGKNGTDSMDGSYPVGIDTSIIGQDYTTLGDTTGANEKAIAKANLPAVGIGMFSANVNGSGGDIPGANDPVARAGVNGGQLDYEERKGSGTPNIGKTANLGDGTNFNVQPKSVISLYIVKIA